MIWSWMHILWGFSHNPTSKTGWIEESSNLIFWFIHPKWQVSFWLLFILLFFIATHFICGCTYIVYWWMAQTEQILCLFAFSLRIILLICFWVYLDILLESFRKLYMVISFLGISKSDKYSFWIEMDDGNDGWSIYQ